MSSGPLFGIFVALVWMIHALMSHGFSNANDIIRKLIFPGVVGTGFGMFFGFLFYIFDSFKKTIK